MAYASTHNFIVTAIIGDDAQDYKVEATCEADAVVQLKPELAAELAQAEREGAHVNFYAERELTDDELFDLEAERVRRYNATAE